MCKPYLALCVLLATACAGVNLIQLTPSHNVAVDARTWRETTLEDATDVMVVEMRHERLGHLATRRIPVRLFAPHEIHSPLAMLSIQNGETGGAQTSLSVASSGGPLESLDSEYLVLNIDSWWMEPAAVDGNEQELDVEKRQASLPLVVGVPASLAIRGDCELDVAWEKPRGKSSQAEVSVPGIWSQTSDDDATDFLHVELTMPKNRGQHHERIPIRCYRAGELLNFMSFGSGHGWGDGFDFGGFSHVRFQSPFGWESRDDRYLILSTNHYLVDHEANFDSQLERDLSLKVGAPGTFRLHAPGQEAPDESWLVSVRWEKAPPKTTPDRSR